MIRCRDGHHYHEFINGTDILKGQPCACGAVPAPREQPYGGLPTSYLMEYLQEEERQG